MSDDPPIFSSDAIQAALATSTFVYQDTGGPAFPTPNGHPGLSLRDYFAAHAMVACAPRDSRPPRIAELAYALADAMLTARKLTP